MRIGILGGTFDPPHVGHLIAAADAIDALSLDEVVLIPAASQPLKQGAIVAAPQQRLAMVRLLIGDDPRLAVDSIEIDRAGLSFMVDTLRELTRRSPGGGAGDQRFLLMGADVVRTLPQWRDPLGIMRMAQIVVLRRGDADADDVAQWLPRGAEGVGSAVGVGEGGVEREQRRPPYRLLDTRRVDVSSTELRARIAAGRSIHGFVPDAVRHYIEDSGLYRDAADREERDAQSISR